jgi:hypothetical protein
VCARVFFIFMVTFMNLLVFVLVIYIFSMQMHTHDRGSERVREGAGGKREREKEKQFTRSMDSIPASIAGSCLKKEKMAHTVSDQQQRSIVCVCDTHNCVCM